MNNLGKIGEIAAANYLRKKHYKLVDVNFHSRFGEIDLIASNKKYIVFVEVKMRNENSIALPREFVDENKQRKIATTAEVFLQNFKTTLQPRFDVIEVYTEKDKIKMIKHLENAFQL